MPPWRVLLILLTILLSNSISRFVIPSQNKECFVRDQIVLDYQDDHSHNLLFCIKPEDQIAVQVSFLNKNRPFYNDLLLFKHASGEIQCKRGENTTSKNITLKDDIQLGWNYINITVQDRRLAIGTFYHSTGLDYDIKDVTIYTKHLATKYLISCEEKIAIWKIDEKEEVIIPLIGLSKFELNLNSNHIFQPEFILNNISFPLRFDKQLVVRKSTQPLPPNNYRIVFAKHKDMLSIFSILIHEDYKLLMSTRVDEDFLELKVKSITGYFILTFNSFPEDQFEVGTMITKSAPTTENSFEENNDSELENKHGFPVTERDVKYSAQASSIGWEVATWVVSAIALISIIANIYLLRKNRSMSFLKEESMQGGSEMNRTQHEEEGLLCTPNLHSIKIQCDHIRIAIIIFNTTSPNSTTQLQLVKKMWGKLKFNVITIKDPTDDELEDQLESIRTEINSHPNEHDALALMYIGPGGCKSTQVNGKEYRTSYITLKDSHMPVKSLQTYFLARNCPGLDGKPKVQIIQRFKDIDEERPVKLRSPAAAGDFSDSFLLETSVNAESEFISTLYDVFTRDHATHEIASMSETVRRKIQHIEENNELRNLFFLDENI